MAHEIHGTCLCGALHYEVNAAFDSTVHCHCSMCRKHHGSMFATFACAPLMSFRWKSGEQQVAKFQSSEQGIRSFCKTCGSVAPALIESLDQAVCPAGNLLDADVLKPQSHFFAASKPGWYAITDTLPQFEEYPPEFGAMSVPRPVIEPRPGVTAGSCLCGKVAYEITGAPLRMANCHCTRCRRARSAAHATNLMYSKADFTFTHGAELLVEYKVPDARYFTTAFCSHCGSITPYISHERGIVVVPAGSLDTDPHIQPIGHIFVAFKAPWFQITDTLPQFDAMPS